MKKRKKEIVNDDTNDFAARFMMWMAAGIIMFTFIYIFCITFIEVPAANRRFTDTIIGFLVGTLVGTIINYFYGSSKGSSDKNNKALSIITQLQSKLNEGVDDARKELSDDDSASSSSDDSADDSSDNNDKSDDGDKADASDDKPAAAKKQPEDFDARFAPTTTSDEHKVAKSEGIYATDDDVSKANS